MTSDGPGFDVGQERRIRDAEHLRVLVICHYVYAGIIALLSLLPVFRGLISFRFDR